MIDLVDELHAVHRSTGNKPIGADGAGRTVVLRRTYDAPVDDVWDAITNPDRINRWFLPVSGDLRLGGTYQLQGNAGGEILRCEPPHLLKVSWVFGDPAEADVSEVEARLSSDGDARTVLELEHAAVVDPKMWAEYGPGATGVGWDLVLLGLGMHLRGEVIDDREAWERSPAARDLMTRSSVAWGAAHEASGAPADAVAAAVENTTKFYAPDPDAGDGGG